MPDYDAPFGNEDYQFLPPTTDDGNDEDYDDAEGDPDESEADEEADGD